MSGALELGLVERETQKSVMATTTQQDHWQWQVQFARCFVYPSSYISKATTTTTTTNTPLSPLKRSLFKPIWISSSAPSTVSLHPFANSSSSEFILSVSVQGTIIEEHFISKLQFAWPQVSCLSGFPTRGSLVVLASYVDTFDEKQKFAMRFSEVSEVQDFITSLEDILSNKISAGLPVVDVISAISSQSAVIPPYRPDTSSVRTPIHDSTWPINLHNEDQQDSQIQDTIADSQSNAIAFPPRFTSLTSSCSAELEQGKLALALAAEPQDPDLKAQIAKYMQDASFLDIVNKVNEVITELGGDFVM